MSDEQGFRARLRFRVLKPLNITGKMYHFRACERDVQLSPRSPDIPISESEWLVANARGFKSEAEASDFAATLKTAVEISSVATRLGVDTGVNAATGTFAQFIKDRAQEIHGVLIRDDIHGIDVFPDNSNVKFPFISAKGTVMASPDPFLTDIDSLFATAGNLSSAARNIVLLLNYALMRPEPVAQIVFAVSAVEMLGQQERWSENQVKILDWLASEAQGIDIGTEVERFEVAEAIRRGTQKIGLRQGVLRLLTSLDLNHLKREWDILYSERSTLVHGLAPQPGKTYDDLARRTVSLCGRILLRVIAVDVPIANQHVDRFYQS